MKMKMKTIILLVLLAVVAESAVCAEPRRPDQPDLSTGPAPKWTIQRIWRKKVREGLTERAVIRLLGKPTYLNRKSRTTTYRYQKNPIEYKVNTKNVVSLVNVDTCGIVTFNHMAKSRKQGKGPIARPNMLVSIWTEPDFEKCKDATTPIPVKLKPKVKLKKWQKEMNWLRMAFNIDIKVVTRILGEPRSKKVILGTSRIHFYYGNLSGYGTLTFYRDGKLASWSEPFWPDIKERLYKPVKGKK